MKKIILISFILSTHLFADTKVVVISDLNGSYGSKTYHPAVKKSIDEMARLAPDLVVSTGDMVAGQKAGLDYKGMWKSFHDVVTTPLALLGIPFAVTPGNHDGSGATAFKLERAEFVSQWKKHLPKLNFIDQENYPSRYAFAIKDILFVSLDATMVGKFSSLQKNWLAKLLTEHSRYSKKVLFGHLPIFPVTEQKTNEFINDPELIKIMQDHKVDIYLSGHHHAYYPGVHEGIRQISQGCLGAGPRKILGATGISTRSLTVINFQDDGEIKIEAYGGDDLTQLIERKTLPKKIQYEGRQLLRDDLASLTE